MANTNKTELIKIEEQMSKDLARDLREIADRIERGDFSYAKTHIELSVGRIDTLAKVNAQTLM